MDLFSSHCFDVVPGVDLVVDILFRLGMLLWLMGLYFFAIRPWDIYQVNEYLAWVWILSFYETKVLQMIN